jgi:PGF-CTERM protein
MNMMKWKIGAVLILLMFVLPMLANADETAGVYTRYDILAFKEQGWDASVIAGFEPLTIAQLERGIVGNDIMIEGGVSVSLTKGDEWLSGPISDYYLLIPVNKGDVVVDLLSAVTDDNGNFRVEFTPKESGYYNVVWDSAEDWLPLRSAPCIGGYSLCFYISEKDSDEDGVPDNYDYAPYDPNVQSKGDIKTPGFEALFTIAGLVTVAYLLRRRR